MASEFNNEKERRHSCASYNKDSKRITDKMTRLSVPSMKSSINKTKNGDKSAEMAFPNVKKLIRQYDSIVEKKKFSPKPPDSETGFDFRELKVNVENIKDRLDSKSKNSEDDDNSVSSIEYRNPSPKTRRIRGRTKSLKEYFSSQSLLNRGVNIFSYVDLPKNFDGVLEDKYNRSSRSSKRFEVRSYSDSNIGRKGSIVPILPRLDSGTSDMSLDGIPVTFDSWSGSTTSAKNLKRRASATPLSLSPAVSTPSGSIENFRLTKSASCGVLSFPSGGEWKRSVSSDSAVVVEDECKYIDDSRGSMTPSGASVRRNNHYRKESPFLSNDFWNRDFTQSTPLDGGLQRYCESEDYTEKDEYNIVLRRSSARTQRNPSVVISDHSGHSVSVHVAYASEDFSLNNLGSTPDLLQDEYCFPRRKASDCSLCSAFGPGDMEYCICYCSEAGSENISQRRLSDCSTCSYLTASEDEVEISLEEPSILRKVRKILFI